MLRNSQIGDELDPFDDLHAQFVELRSNAERWRTVPVDSQSTADICEAARKQVMALTTTMDDARKAEKKPHDTAAKAVQLKWVPTIEALDRLKIFFGDKVAAYLLAEKRRLAAEQERKRRDVEEAQRKLDEAAEKLASDAATFSDRDAAIAAHSKFLAAGYALEAAEDKTITAGSGAPGVRRVATMRTIPVYAITSPPDCLAALIAAQVELSDVDAALISAARKHMDALKKEGRFVSDFPGISITTREVLV